MERPEADYLAALGRPYQRELSRRGRWQEVRDAHTRSIHRAAVDRPGQRGVQHQGRRDHRHRPSRPGAHPEPRCPRSRVHTWPDDVGGEPAVSRDGFARGRLLSPASRLAAVPQGLQHVPVDRGLPPTRRGARGDDSVRLSRPAAHDRTHRRSRRERGSAGSALPQRPPVRELHRRRRRPPDCRLRAERQQRPLLRPR